MCSKYIILTPCYKNTMICLYKYGVLGFNVSETLFVSYIVVSLRWKIDFENGSAKIRRSVHELRWKNMMVSFVTLSNVIL